MFETKEKLVNMVCHSKDSVPATKLESDTAASNTRQGHVLGLRNAFLSCSGFHDHPLGHQAEEIHSEKCEIAKAGYFSHVSEYSLRLCSLLVTLGAQNMFIHGVPIVAQW